MTDETTAWAETHFEIVQAITVEMMKDKPSGIVAERHEAQGHGGLYELSVELTNEFEELHKDREWNGDYLEEIDLFLSKKL